MTRIIVAPPTDTKASAWVERAEDLAGNLRLVIGRLGRRLRQHAIGGLSPSQISALVSVEGNGPMALGSLARIEGVAPPTITRVATRLEELGLLSRRADP